MYKEKANELSIEEKAKRYDEIIEKLRSLHDDYDTVSTLIDIKKELENILPEIKESKYERLRKSLVDYFAKFKQSDMWDDEFSFGDVLAWFEKKSEQNLANSAKPCKDEQKPANKVEPKFHEGEWVVLTAGELSATLQISKVGANKKLYWFNDSSYLPIVDEGCLHLWTIKDAKDGDVLATLDYILIFKELLKNDDGISYCHYDFRAGNPQFIWSEDKNWYFGKEAIIHPATKEQCDLLFQKMKEAGYEWDAEKKELKKIEYSPVLSNSSNTGNNNQEPADKVESKFKVKYAGSEYNVLDIKEIAGITYYGIEDEPNHIDYVKAENCEIISGYGIKENGSPYPTKPAVFSEQKSKQEWSEEDEKMLKWLCGIVHPQKIRKAITLKEESELGKWIDKWLNHNPQPHLDWSEEDKRKISRIYSILGQAADAHAFSATCRLIGDKECVDLQDFLKSLKGRVQPKAELTQLDKNILEAAIAFVEQNNHFNCWRGIDKHTVLSALHSLKPQNRWKPSDEQMKQLGLIAKQNKDNMIGKELMTLYEDLKKLKGE